MALNKIICFLFSLFSLTISFSGFCKLTEFATKQAIENIRFISNDGKYTYFQQKSGNLILSTNYKNFNVLKGAIDTQYTLVASPTRKKIVVTQDDTFHSNMSLNKQLAIYTIDFGKNTPLKITNGIDPRLHLKDEWISVYNPQNKNLEFYKTSNNVLDFKIHLYNSSNFYFISNVLMLADDHILFTDINNKGLQGLLELKRNNKAPSAILKTQNANQRIELCENDSFIFIGIFPFNNYDAETKIFQVSKSNFDIAKSVQLYQSNKRDLGHLQCLRDKIYFIQNQTDSSNKERYEVVSISLADKKIETLTDIKFVSNLINMDDKLLINSQGVVYTL